MVSIPFSGRAFFVQEVTLDDEPYLLTFDLNYRYQRYGMSIADRAGGALISGVPLVVGLGLIHRFPGRGLPPGEMVLIREDGRMEDVAPEEIGTTAKLMYITEAEYAAL